MNQLRECLKDSKPIVWLFYGDSITQGALHTYGHRDYVQLFEERVRYELCRGTDAVINAAISGNTSEDLAAKFDLRVKRFNPDIVFIMVGMNDCMNRRVAIDKFSKNIESLAGQCADLGSKVVLQTACPPIPGTSPAHESNFTDYMDVIRQKAVDLNLMLIDHAKYWQEHTDKIYFWMNNQIHPNQYGHRVLSRLIFEQMGIFDHKSNCCTLFVP